MSPWLVLRASGNDLRTEPDPLQADCLNQSQDFTSDSVFTSLHVLCNYILQVSDAESGHVNRAHVLISYLESQSAPAVPIHSFTAGPFRGALIKQSGETVDNCSSSNVTQLNMK